MILLVKLQKDKKEVKKITNIDGVRVSEKDGWWLLRASNTQPAIVLRCESLTQEGLEFQKRQLKMNYLNLILI